MRKKWPITLLFLVVAAVIGLVVWLNIKQRPFYIASSAVIVDILKPGKTDYLSCGAYMDTQREVIASRRVAHHVIKNLGLINRKDFKASKDPIAVLLGKLNADVVKGTGVIKINVRDENPEEASRIANEFARVYVNPSLSRIEVNNSRVQDFADAPLQPINPNRKLNTAAFIFLILTGAISSAVFLKKPKDAEIIKDSGDITLLHLPVLGSVPKIKPDGKNIKTKIDADMAVKKDPLCMASEVYRSIRAKLLFSLNSYGSIAKSIVITSSGHKEGKTISAVNLAIMIANSGESVLLVDAHKKRPKVHTVFNMTNDVGFFNFISGDIDIQSIVKYPGIDNLSIITSGDISYRPVESVSSKNIKLFLEKACSVFSKVIFDAPPVPSMGEMAMLLNICDGVVLVAESNKTKKDNLNSSRELLRKKSANIIGVILNDVLL
jgi:polysaccharide biosynthesis transport protein